MAINQRKERTNRKQRDSRDFRKRTLCRRDANEKRQQLFREKRQNKKISLAFSLSLSLQSFVSSVVAFGRRYESYLINLFLLQEERFHDERRREKGKFRVYCIPSRRRGIVFLVFVGAF